MESNQTLVRCIFRNPKENISDGICFCLLTNLSSLNNDNPSEKNVGTLFNSFEWVWLFHVICESDFEFKLAECENKDYQIQKMESAEKPHVLIIPKISVDQALSIELHWDSEYHHKIITIDEILNENEDLFEKLSINTENCKESPEIVPKENIPKLKERLPSDIKFKITTESLDSICGSSSEIEEIMSHSSNKLGVFPSSKHSSSDIPSSASDKKSSENVSKIDEKPAEDEVFSLMETDDGLIDVDKILLENGALAEHSNTEILKVDSTAILEPEPEKSRSHVIIAKIHAFLGLSRMRPKYQFNNIISKSKENENKPTDIEESNSKTGSLSSDHAEAEELQNSQNTELKENINEKINEENFHNDADNHQNENNRGERQSNVDNNVEIHRDGIINDDNVVQNDADNKTGLCENEIVEHIKISTAYQEKNNFENVDRDNPSCNVMDNNSSEANCILTNEIIEKNITKNSEMNVNFTENITGSNESETDQHNKNSDKKEKTDQKVNVENTEKVNNEIIANQNEKQNEELIEMENSVTDQNVNIEINENPEAEEGNQEKYLTDRVHIDAHNLGYPMDKNVVNESQDIIQSDIDIIQNNIVQNSPCYNSPTNENYVEKSNSKLLGDLKLNEVETRDKINQKEMDNKNKNQVDPENNFGTLFIFPLQNENSKSNNETESQYYGKDNTVMMENQDSENNKNKIESDTQYKNDAEIFSEIDNQSIINIHSINELPAKYCANNLFVKYTESGCINDLETINEEIYDEVFINEMENLENQITNEKFENNGETTSELNESESKLSEITTDEDKNYLESNSFENTQKKDINIESQNNTDTNYNQFEAELDMIQSQSEGHKQKNENNSSNLKKFGKKSHLKETDKNCNSLNFIKNRHIKNNHQEHSINNDFSLTTKSEENLFSIPRVALQYDDDYILKNQNLVKKNQNFVSNQNNLQQGKKSPHFTVASLQFLNIESNESSLVTSLSKESLDDKSTDNSFEKFISTSVVSEIGDNSCPLQAVEVAMVTCQQTPLTEVANCIEDRKCTDKLTLCGVAVREDVINIDRLKNYSCGEINSTDVFNVKEDVCSINNDNKKINDTNLSNNSDKIINTDENINLNDYKFQEDLQSDPTSCDSLSHANSLENHSMLNPMLCFFINKGSDQLSLQQNEDLDLMKRRQCPNNKTYAEASNSSNHDSAVICDSDFVSDSLSAVGTIVHGDSFEEFIFNHPMTTSQTVDSLFLSAFSSNKHTISEENEPSSFSMETSHEVIFDDTQLSLKSKDSIAKPIRPTGYCSLQIPPRTGMKRSPALEGVCDLLNKTDDELKLIQLQTCRSINDDDLYPDSLTPTKADSSLRIDGYEYDIPYIDADALYNDGFNSPLVSRFKVRARLANCDECTLTSTNDLSITNSFQKLPKQPIAPTAKKKQKSQNKFLLCCGCLSRNRKRP